MRVAGMRVNAYVVSPDLPLDKRGIDVNLSAGLDGVLVFIEGGQIHRDKYIGTGYDRRTYGSSERVTEQFAVPPRISGP